MILKDYSLTLSILRRANSCLNNRTDRRIRSISQAVTLLGFEAVREIAVGLVLLEHFRKPSPGLKELILLSLLTAHHAREVADQVGYVQREEAYLCGMFRNLGEILVACYYPREYAAVLIRIQDRRIPVAQACLEILGFQYDDAGKALAIQWCMPEIVLQCMSDRVVRMRRAPSTEQERLEAITHFSHKLTAAVYRREVNTASASVNLLLDSLGPVLGLTHENVKIIVDRSLKETADVFIGMSMPLDRLRLKRQTEAALEPIEDEGAPETLVTMLRDVTIEVDRGREYDFGAATRMITAAIHRGGSFDRVLFATSDPGGHRLVGQSGFGEGVEVLIANFNFPIAGASGPVGSAMLMKADVFVAGPPDRRYEGTKFSQVVGAAVFGLFSLGVRRIHRRMSLFRSPKGESWRCRCVADHWWTSRPIVQDFR